METTKLQPNPFNKRVLTKEILNEWQELLDIAADTLVVPAGLITRVDVSEIEIFLSSNTKGNPYQAGYKKPFPESGFYCEWAIRNKKMLLIPNALKDPDWATNEAAKAGMISYAGVPISNPDGTVFGTICFIDNKENAHNERSLKLLGLFKKMIESSLKAVFTKREIESRERLLRDLSLLYPICSICRKIKNTKGQWVTVESYIREISGGSPTHGLCPDCLAREMGSHPAG
jgi:GAF domain-containing protein